MNTLLLFFRSPPSLAIWLLLLSQTASAEQGSDLAAMDLMDLMKVELVSSSKFKQELSDVMASAYVITEEQIRDSRASNLPELLSMVPGLTISTAGSNNWAMGIRGFNGLFSNKMLVMIDGRSLFSPIFSGVFWEQLDLFLPDIERIEVIRGAGSTVWGANAVNGVINIITKSTLDNDKSQLYAKGGSGTKFDVGVRFGTQITEQSYARFYAKSKDIDSYDYDDPSATDDWSSHAVGGKWELFSGRDSVVISADWIEQDSNDTGLWTSRMPTRYTPLDNRSGNVSMQWQRQMSTEKAYTLALQWQQNTRDSDYYRIDDDMLNLDLDTSIAWQNHQFNLGFGARRHDIEFDTGIAFDLSDGSDKVNTEAVILSAYVQDEWQLSDKHHLLLGAKFESHDHQYGQIFEYDEDVVLPTIRYRFDISEQARLWMALSKSARIPSMSEHIIRIPVYTFPPDTPVFNPTPLWAEVQSVGNERFTKETMRSFELGFRLNINNSNRIDMVAFYNQYDDTRSFILQAPMCVVSGMPVPLCAEQDMILQENTFENGGEMAAVGFEVTWQSRINEELSLQANYSFINQVEEVLPTHDFEEPMYMTPKHQLAWQLDWHMADNWNVLLQHKYVAGIDDSRTPRLIHVGDFLDHYHNVDINVSYDYSDSVNIYVGVDNLLDEDGFQWTPEFPLGSVGRSQQRLFIGFDVTY